MLGLRLLFVVSILVKDTSGSRRKPVFESPSRFPYLSDTHTHFCQEEHRHKLRKNIPINVLRCVLYVCLSEYKKTGRTLILGSNVLPQSCLLFFPIFPCVTAPLRLRRGRID